MLEFWSANNDIVSSRKAMNACLESALGAEGGCDLLIFHTTMGHNYRDLVAAARERCPTARIVGCTGSGVIGRGSASEKMRTLAIMAIRGSAQDFSIAYSPDLSYERSFEVGRDVALQLKKSNPHVNMINVLASGIHIVADRVLEGIAEVFGPELPVFGGTASDNIRAVGSIQSVDDHLLETGLIMVGFSDPSLELVTGVHHGNVCVGEALKVTRSEGNRILEFNGEPAWPLIMGRMNLPLSTKFQDALRVVCFGAALPESLHAEYGNQHVLYVPFGVDEQRQSFYLAVTIEEGTMLWLTQRDEGRMFDGLDRMMDDVVRRLGGRKPVAVFHTDCAARGRMSFNLIEKDEIISRMQRPLMGDAAVPWLGLYGFGELTMLGGRNRFHNQTTSVYALVRR